MTNDASPVDRRPARGRAPAGPPPAQFECLPGGEGEPAVVRAAGDIDLTNVGQFQAVLAQAAATAGAVTADLTAVTYCDSASIRELIVAARQTRLTIQVATTGPISATLLSVSGLDQIATVTLA